MAIGQLTPLPIFAKYKEDGTVRVFTDTMKCALLLSTALPFLATAVRWDDVAAYEIPAAGGYTTGGLTLSNPSIVYSNGVAGVLFDYATFLASGAPIPAHRVHFFYKLGTALGVANPACFYGLRDTGLDFDSTPDGTPLTLRWAAQGLTGTQV